MPITSQFLKSSTSLCLTFTVLALRQRLRTEASAVLSSPSIEDQLAPEIAHPRPKQTLAEHRSKQKAYAQQNLYRTTIPITAFKVNDPDPNAVDGGHILGLRFEIMSKGQFLRPHYVILNRPYPNSKHLRVHRHTIPPGVPFAGLAARYLPPPQSGASSTQNLNRFVRALRRGIVGYYNRLGLSADLRRGLVLHDREKGTSQNEAVIDVGIADIEAKQITLTWPDERTGRLIMDNSGAIEKLLGLGKDGDRWVTSQEIVDKEVGVEGLVSRLAENGSES